MTRTSPLSALFFMTPDVFDIVSFSIGWDDFYEIREQLYAMKMGWTE